MQDGARQSRRAPVFAFRFRPEVRVQVERAAEAEGVTLGRWIHAAVEERLRLAALGGKVEG